MINIAELGADPSKSDNTEAIQLAIYKGKSLRDYTIFIPGGVFNVLGEIEDYDNFTFVGQSTPKHYWNHNNDDVFSDGASVLKGNGTKPLFKKPGQTWHATIRNVSFTGFTKVCEPADCRSFRFIECSFKDMVVMNAPSNQPDKYQSFRFIECAFTVYGSNNTVFQGRIEDSEWFSNIFVGNKSFDLNQGKANKIYKNRFEWIDRDAAISLYDCDDVKIKNNWFDRVAGVGVQVKQYNQNLVISGNEFNRCGGLVQSSGSALSGVGESFRANIQVYGDQDGNMKIDDNLFKKGPISDLPGAAIAPKYVLSLEGIGQDRKFSFKGNRHADGLAYTDSLIYSAASWMASATTIETETTFDHLDDAVVDLSKYSGSKVVAYNTEQVSVKDIPDNLIVNNSFNASITLPTGVVQTGVVFGGKVNGIRRFSKLEQLHENLAPTDSVNGQFALNKISFTVNVSKALYGAPIYLAFNYNTYGVPDGIIEIADAAGTTVIGSIPSLTLSVPGGTQQMHVAKFVLPFDYDDASIKVNIYAAKPAAKSSSDVINISGFCATYGDWITKGVIDLANV